MKGSNSIYQTTDCTTFTNLQKKKMNPLVCGSYNIDVQILVVLERIKSINGSIEQVLNFRAESSELEKENFVYFHIYDRPGLKYLISQPASLAYRH